MKQTYMRAESLSSMAKLSGRRRSNNPNTVNGPSLGMEFEPKNYESNQTDDKNNYNKLIMKTKTIKSPKRAGIKPGVNPKHVNVNSVERDRVKDKLQREAKNFDAKKTSNSVSKDVFHTLYSLKKNDAIHSSSLNNFQPVKKSEYQTIGKHDKGGTHPKVIEATPNKTPGKFKKSTYLNSYKKVSQLQSLQSAKTLNHSMNTTTSKSGAVLL